MITLKTLLIKFVFLSVVKVKQEPIEERRATPKKLVFYSDSEESDNEHESENDSSSSGSETSGSESGSESDSEYSSSDDSGSEYSSDDDSDYESNVVSSTATGDVVDLTADSDEDDNSEDDPDYEYESQSDVEFSDDELAHDEFHELSVLASQVLRWKNEHNIGYDDVLLIHSMLMLRFHNKDI